MFTAWTFISCVFRQILRLAAPKGEMGEHVERIGETRKVHAISILKQQEISSKTDEEENYLNLFDSRLN
jgi:hypothetical protein